MIFFPIVFETTDINLPLAGLGRFEPESFKRPSTPKQGWDALGLKHSKGPLQKQDWAASGLKPSKGPLQKQDWDALSLRFPAPVDPKAGLGCFEPKISSSRRSQSRTGLLQA